MPEPVTAVLALVLYTAAIVAATTALAGRRHRPGQAPQQFARERKALQRAIDAADASTGILLCSVEPSGVVALDADRDEEQQAAALIGGLRGRFGAEAVFRPSPQEVALLVPEGNVTVRREAAAAVREAATSVGLEGMLTVGTAHGPGRGRGPSSTLWARVSTAAHHARQRGGGAVVAYEDIAASLVVVTEEAVDGVRQLLAGRRVAVTYQPIFHLAPREVLGFEALSRPDASYGLLGPEQAFAAAMRIGRAAELDAVCRAAVLDDAPGLDMPRDSLLFLNVTPAGLTHPSLAAPVLLPAVRLAGLSPERVVLELTAPSTLDAKTVQSAARTLADLGFKIALDDVGASQAATDLVALVPADFLKVDAGLLRAAEEDPLARSLVRGVCEAAAANNATVIAKGVEQTDLLDRIGRLPGAPGAGTPGIGAAQGHALSPPNPRPAAGTPEAVGPTGSDADEPA